MYKEKLQEYIESDAFTNFTKHVIPVNLNQVSDIVKPVMVSNSYFSYLFWWLEILWEFIILGTWQIREIHEYQTFIAKKRQGHGLSWIFIPDDFSEVSIKKLAIRK